MIKKQPFDGLIEFCVELQEALIFILSDYQHDLGQIAQTYGKPIKEPGSDSRSSCLKINGVTRGLADPTNSKAPYFLRLHVWGRI